METVNSRRQVMTTVLRSPAVEMKYRLIFMLQVAA